MKTCSSAPRFDVLLQGDPYCDLTFAFGDRDGLPPLGQEVFADAFAINPGGIFNVVSTLTKLGVRVGLVACLGNDIFSRFIAERMEVCGIPLDLTTWVDEPRPIVTAGISFPRDRVFISYSKTPHGEFREVRITLDDLDRYTPRVLFTYGEVGIDLMRAARARGIVIYTDTFWSVNHLHSPYLRSILEYVDIFSPNLSEALEMTGATSADEALGVLSDWSRCVAIKCGASGCLACCDGERYVLPAIPVDARETTGAGDNFNAGFIYGLLHGYSFERCLQCATIVGGLSTLAIGGSGFDIAAPDVERWLGQLARAGKEDRV